MISSRYGAESLLHEGCFVVKIEANAANTQPTLGSGKPFLRATITCLPRCFMASDRHNLEKLQRRQWLLLHTIVAQ